MAVREIKENELNELLELYTHLHETGIPEQSEKLAETWETIINDKNHHIIVAEENGFTAISMKDNWKTIYGDNVARK